MPQICFRVRNERLPTITRPLEAIAGDGIMDDAFQELPFTNHEHTWRIGVSLG